MASKTLDLVGNRTSWVTASTDYTRARVLEPTVSIPQIDIWALAEFHGFSPPPESPTVSSPHIGMCSLNEFARFPLLSSLRSVAT